jgi:copper chaperone CopZ
MVSPDAVDYYNRTGYSKSDTAAITHYLVGIEGMSCMACAHRVKQTLETSLLVEEAKIFFHNASAIITVAITSSTDNHANHIVERVHNLDDKYSAVILDSW